MLLSVFSLLTYNFLHVYLSYLKILDQIQEQVSNNVWGVRNIKDMNDQIKSDLGALKDLQLAHNNTVWMVTTHDICSDVEN